MRTILAAGALALAACAATGPERSDDLFARIAPGMTAEDVRRVAGTPDETMRFPLSGNTSWGYQYQDTWGYIAVFSVTFAPDGRAVSKSVRRVNEGGDHGT